MATKKKTVKLGPEMKCQKRNCFGCILQSAITCSGRTRIRCPYLVHDIVNFRVIGGK